MPIQGTLPLGMQWRDAIFARIVKKVGERRCEYQRQTRLLRDALGGA